MAETRTTSRRGGFYAFMTKIRHFISAPQGTVNQDSGSVLVEAMIAMFLIAVVSTAFTAGMIGATKAQRTAQRNDITYQAANGVLEKAKSVSWSNLGIQSNDPSRVVNDILVTTPVANFKANQPVVVRNEKVQLKTNIYWVSGPAAGGVNLSGTKRIAVTAIWKDSYGTTITNTFTINRTSNVSEAVPANIPAYNS